MRLYDRFRFGDLADISMIDGRQYRSREACYGPPKKGGAHLETNDGCPERLEADRTMIGAEQEAWLFDGLSSSKSKWNVIAQVIAHRHIRLVLRPLVVAAFGDCSVSGIPGVVEIEDALAA